MKRIIALLLCIAVNIPIYSMALDQATFKVGEKFFNKKLYSEAEKRFLDIVRKYPDSNLFHDSLFYLGQTYAHMGKYKSAMHYYRLLLDKSTSIKQKQQAVLGIAKSWLQLGKHDKAGDFYSFFVSEYPESEYAPAALYFAGISREREGNNNAAIEKYRALLDDYPQSKYYSQSIEKIALLTSDTPDHLWSEPEKSNTIKNDASRELFAGLDEDTDNTLNNNMRSISQDTNIIAKQDSSSVPNQFDANYEDMKYKAQLSDGVFLVAPEPSAEVANSPRVLTQILQSPTVITQMIQSSNIITQTVQSPPIVITQTVTQFITQQVQSPSRTGSDSRISENITDSSNMSLQQQDLESYRRLWEEQYQLKLKAQEIEQAQQKVRDIVELSTEKAQILNVKEEELLERQNSINNSLYQELAQAVQTNTLAVINTNSNINTNSSETNTETNVETSSGSTGETEENIETSEYDDNAFAEYTGDERYY